MKQRKRIAPFAFLVMIPFWVYRAAISPSLPKSCRYEPTCSAYALEAIERHGGLWGLYLTTRRVLRCHPIKWLGGGEGYDPVPEHPPKLPGLGRKER